MVDAHLKHLYDDCTIRQPSLSFDHAIQLCVVVTTSIHLVKTSFTVDVTHVFIYCCITHCWRLRTAHDQAA